MKINPQEKLFVRIHDEYSKHYYDNESLKYRERFIYNYIFQNEDFNNKKIAEIACGSGFNSLAILKRFPKANLNGYDISKPACDDYKRLVKADSYVWDMTKDKINKLKYDYVIVFGGLHHCIQDLNTTFQNIFEMLNDNGKLIMFEPNKNYFLDFVRVLWYKLDNYFDANSEDSLNHIKLLNTQKDMFKLEKIKYFGGPSYFLIYNSLIFRLPLYLKPLISKFLLFFEEIYNKFGNKYLYPVFIAKWKKI